MRANLSRRLIGLFLPGNHGERPINGGRKLFHVDPVWHDHVVFPECFHGDIGAALGASQQTGWTAPVAKLISQSGT